MDTRTIARFTAACLLLTLVTAAFGCGGGDGKVTSLSQLEGGKTFAVPEGTVADQLVLSRLPGARFKYYPDALASCMAVQAGEADAAAYDEPILRNIAAKNEGLVVLEEMITEDGYGFAVQLGREDLINSVDNVVAGLRQSGEYQSMLDRWLPAKGSPGPMPDIELTGDKGVLRFGTAAVTEPFSYRDSAGSLVGFDIELAMRVARELGMRVEFIDMDFGEMIPALTTGRVDMIGACITITPERSSSVLFSRPYYTGGIAALVKE